MRGAIHQSLHELPAMTDLYTNLDIPRSASPAEVKRAYRKAAKAAHPDTPTGSSEKFQKLTRAYLVLSDPARREKYDRTGDIDEQTVDNTLSQAVSIIIGAVMSAVDGYIKGQSADPSKSDMVDAVKTFVKRNIAQFKEQKRQMEKAQASLKDIARRWAPLARGKPDAKKQTAFLKLALDQQAAGTAEPLAKIGRQIETYKLALELLDNSSFSPAEGGRVPATRAWKSIYEQS
jgi:curved DNA-binding protein CbpA